MEQQKRRNWFARVFDFRMFLYDFAKVTGAIPVLIWLRIKKIYINKKNSKHNGPIMVISNHPGFKDPIILLATFLFRRLTFVASDVFFKEKNLLSFLFKSFKCVPVNKENISLKTFKGVKNNFSRGYSVAIFPEGGVGKTQDVRDFKGGAVKMALMNNVPILPVYIKEAEKWYHCIKVVIGEIFDPKLYVKGEKPTPEEIENISTMLKEYEEKLMLEAQKNK